MRATGVMGRLTKMGMSALLALSLAPVAVSAEDLAPVGFQDDEFVGGLIEDTSPALSIHDQNEWLQPQADLPRAYSSRDLGYVTQSDNQGAFGTCWAFSMNAALEGYLLSHGYASQPSDVDLSERHLTYFAYHVAPDPLGNTTGDATEAVGAHYLNRGATLTMGSHVLESWTGCALESAVPTYADLLSVYRTHGRADDAFFNEVALSQDLSHSVNSFHVTGSLRIPLRDSKDIKAAIMEYGAVAAGYKQMASCYNAATYAYYNPSVRQGDGHGVAIIGWDDDFSADDFRGPTKPSGNGAWLIKNSWGPTWGDQGCFWISYEDPTLITSTGKALALQAEPADVVDNIYQYDGASGECYNTVASGGSIASVFTARANQGGAERLDAVSFSLSDVNVDYSVQVYTNPKDQGDPTSGRAMLSEPVTGRTSYAGYYTAKLPKPVQMREGTTYAVVVTLSHQDGTPVGYDVDCTYGAYGRYASSYGWVNYTCHVEEGQSFELDVPGEAWADLALPLASDPSGYDIDDEPNCCARLKAFTSNISLDELDLPEPRAMHRLYNPHTGEHFYTASDGERNAVVSAGWVYEGIGWYAPSESEVAVYRLYNKYAGDHHYTTNAGERDALADAGWIYEGIGWYSDENQEVPVYRQYNPNAVTGAHNFTTNEGEARALVTHGWMDEGIAWYGMAN